MARSGIDDERAFDAAVEAIRLVHVDPAAAREKAEKAAVSARAEGDGTALSIAERALGLAAREQQDVEAALAHLRRAVKIAEHAGDAYRAAEARMSLSLVLAHRGRTVSALREADLAAEVLTGPEAGLLEQQRALVLQHMGRLDEALEGYRRALPALRRAGNTLVEARVLCNRGVLHAYRGAFRGAEADLRKAERLFSELGQGMGVAAVRHNLGFVAARRGDVAAALEWFDLADEQYRKQGVRRGELLLDRAELLMSVRLVGEARAAIDEAIEELTAGGTKAGVAEARLMQSQAALLDGDVSTARESAAQAARAFAAQRRPNWAVLARYARLRAEWAAGDRSESALAAALRAASGLRSAGWAVPAIDARLLAARIALEIGNVGVAERELSSASRSRRRGPVELRSRAWHAHALLWLARGDRRRAEESLRSGMQVLEDYRAALGATELRAHVSAQGADLALTGLRLALEDADAARVLEWAERWRAGSLTSRGARPPRDDALAVDLASLRRVAEELQEAAFAGRDTGVLLRQQAELEEAVRRRCLRATGGTSDRDEQPSVEDLRAALGERALVEIVDFDGRAWAVSVNASGIRLHQLGPMSEAETELEGLQFSLRRMASGRGSARSVEAAAVAARHAAERLDALLLRALGDELGDGGLVIAPTGAFHALPWPLLPSCRGRAVVVTPSARLWHRATTSAEASDTAGRVVLVAGPGVPHGAKEVTRLASSYPAAQRLSEEDATVAAVLAGLDGARVAHVAAHGSFRADNPLFSSVRLADGPMTVYDLESLSRAPSLLLLSACESGLSAVQPGNELMGLAAAVLRAGTRSLIASVIAVPDAETSELMVAFHDRLRAGCAPAVALAEVQAAALSADSRTLAGAAGFVCFGAG